MKKTADVFEYENTDTWPRRVYYILYILQLTIYNLQLTINNYLIDDIKGQIMCIFFCFFR